MRMSIVNTIFKKEILEVLRDKRTLFLVILLPFFLYPVLFAFIGAIGKSQQEKLTATKVNVLLDSPDQQSPITEILNADAYLTVEEREFTQEELDTMKNTIGVRVMTPFESAKANFQPVEVRLYANSTKDLLKSRKNSIKRKLENLNQIIVEERMADARLAPSFLTPLVMNEIDLAPVEAQYGKEIGRFLPIALMFFIFIGILNVAIDMTVGEKERRTLQTIFTAPVKITEIIAGKFLAVFTVGIVSAFMNLMSLVLALIIQLKLMGAEMSTFSLSVSPMGWVWLILLIILATVFIAAICLAIFLLGNTYKEAQSYVGPLMMLIVLPAVVAMGPGMELTTTTALIPFVNIFLAMGAIFVGKFSTSLMALVVLMALVYAALALLFAVATFRNEGVITGQKVKLNNIFRS